MKYKDSPYFSFLISPSKGTSSFSFRLSRFFVINLIIGFFIVVIGLIVIFFGMVRTPFDTDEYQALKTLSIQQQNQLNELNLQMDDLKDELKQLVEKEEVIRHALGESQIKKQRQKLYRKRKKKRYRKSSSSYQFEKKYQRLSKTSMEKEYAQNALTLFEKQTTKLKESFKDHEQLSNLYKDRFSGTPSIWPIYGRILSRYGYRTHPITRKRKFHRGIDIPSWTGAPIKATADGVVLHAGWARTFGNMVVIRHQMGFLTKYAHASRVLVRKGQYVKKGEAIAQIGRTGLSTGPHLHYEITRWNKPVNPIRYLNLDLFTASTQIW